MRKGLLLLFLLMMTAPMANAQFWKKEHYDRLPLLQPSTVTFNLHQHQQIVVTPLKPVPAIERSRYSYDAEEAYLMKGLYHSLRFRIYPDVQKGFNSLIALYIKESRYSEAKWYLLQCNYFGHKTNDQDVIISSLVSLGMLKADIGEYDQAKDDLLQAQDICKSEGRNADAADIGKKLKLVEVKRFANVKNDVRYAELTDDAK